MTWTNCCKGRASGCPEIRIDEHDARIRDDFGAEVVMTHEQLLDVIRTGSEILAAKFPPVAEDA